MQIVGTMYQLHSNKIICHTIVCNEAMQVRHKHIGFPNKVGNLDANF
jgi:hypothetical protein